MKQTITLLVMLAAGSLYSQAQQPTKNARTSIGIRGGINIQNITGKDHAGNNINGDMLTAFSAGITVDIPIAPHFYMQPGLLYSQKGAKNLQESWVETENSTMSISYVELPINFLYKPLLGKGHLLLGAGPYVAMGVGGNFEMLTNGISVDKEVKFQNSVSNTDAGDVVYIKPWDAGANLLAGYEFRNKLSFQLNAQLGLTKINPSYDAMTTDQADVKNTGFGFSVGYRF